MRTVGKSVLKKQNIKLDLRLDTRFSQGFILASSAIHDSDKGTLIIPSTTKSVKIDAETYEINRKKQDIIKLTHGTQSPYISIYVAMRGSLSGVSEKYEEISKKELEWLKKFLTHHGTKLPKDIYIIDKQSTRILRQLIIKTEIDDYTDIDPKTDIKTLNKIISAMKKF